MNAFVPFIACVFALNVCWDSDYNHVILTRRKLIIQGYCDEEDTPVFKKKFKIENFKDFRYFNLGHDTVYIDYNAPPEFSEPLTEYFSKRISIIPNEISGRHHLYEICFVVDKNGHIKERGFLMGEGNEVYRKQLTQAMNDVELSFIPGKINGRNVSVLYSFELDLSSSDFK